MARSNRLSLYTVRSAQCGSRAAGRVSAHAPCWPAANSHATPVANVELIQPCNHVILAPIVPVPTCKRVHGRRAAAAAAGGSGGRGQAPPCSVRRSPGMCLLRPGTESRRVRTTGHPPCGAASRCHSARRLQWSEQARAPSNRSAVCAVDLTTTGGRKAGARRLLGWRQAQWDAAGKAAGGVHLLSG